MLSARFAFDDLLLILHGGHAAAAQDRRGDPGALLQQPQHNVFGADIGMPERLGRFDSQVQGGIGFFSESFKPVHDIPAFLIELSGSGQPCADHFRPGGIAFGRLHLFSGHRHHGSGLRVPDQSADEVQRDSLDHSQGYPHPQI